MGKMLLLASDYLISSRIWGLVLNSMHIYEGEGAGHSDSKSLINLCAITLTNDGV